MSQGETYNDQVVRLFLLAAAVWAIVGTALGVLAAAQMAWPELNFGVSWLTFSRIRPNHTFAIIFAFGGSALMGTCYYVVQRTCHVRLALGRLATFTFWGWQAAVLLALATIPFGITQSKEYAEPEWPIDILIAVVWISFAIVFFATLARRRIQHIYVANWYYAAFIVAVALLHVVNNIAIPVSLTKSYPVYSGAVDAMVQWWYGHNAVAFFLTAGFLGMMYYFVPRQARQPLWSYRFSIVNFWALISVYMWAGAHHLVYTSLPDWVQSVGMVFSLVLLMPSWGSAANGLFTFNGSWHLLRTDPAAKFMVVSLVFYAASTLEGSMLAIKSANALSHYSDWTVAHVHSGAIGWVAMITIGSLYAMAPRALGRPMHSVRAMDLHFWMHTGGLLLYVVAMWAAGITAGQMWFATGDDGSLLYSFMDSLRAIHPFYILRFIGGLLVMGGMVVMAWNLWHTAAAARAHLISPIPVPVPEPVADQTPPPRAPQRA
ncbi:MAG: cytochrome-c oxidase, cbb3-type subunit I [Halofilum sp. (in: g-proteobacteria)]|nr:cytochrome-c oxidase, cbb3-type subunit I [Halofilum sp. (in: g-proteobacteria)]